jgi:hypothetical protein
LEAVRHDQRLDGWPQAEMALCKASPGQKEMLMSLKDKEAQGYSRQEAGGQTAAEEVGPTT